MAHYIIRRLGLLVGVLVVLSLATFIFSRVVPSNPAKLYAGFKAKPEQEEAVRRKLGLDRPLYVQYAYYVRDLLRGDLGDSLLTKEPVLRGIAVHAPASLELITLAMLVALLAGIPLGVMSARRENSLLDHSSRLLSVAGVAMPTFWIGLLLQLLFFRLLRVLPLGGRLDTMTTLLHPVREITGFYTIDTIVTGNWPALRSFLAHLVLPAVTLALYPLGMIARMTRATMLEVLREEYVLAARSIGYAERRIAYTYALRNALAPTVTTAGLTFAYMLTGTFFTELIFSYPGLGSYTVNAILNIDYPVIMGVTLVGAAFYVLVNLAVDIILLVIDPRIRIG